MTIVVIVRYGSTYVHVHKSGLVRALESKAMYNNKTTDNIESDEDGRNTDAARNGTENTNDFMICTSRW